MPEKEFHFEVASAKGFFQLPDRAIRAPCLRSAPPQVTPRDPQQPWHLPRGNHSDFSPKGGEKKRKKVEEASEASPRFVSLPVGAPRVIPMVPQSPAARVQGALSFPSFS